MIKAEGFSVINIDAVILAEAPSLKPYKLQMRSNIARRLAVERDVINIKATTSEGLGFIGQKQGVAAYAVALLSKGR